MAGDRVTNDVLAGDLSLLLGGDEAPAALVEVPVDDGEGDEVLEALEFAGDESAMSLCSCASVK